MFDASGQERGSALESVPAQGELHHWADYIELLCMTDPDGTYSAERLSNRANFADDLMATSPFAQDIDEVDVEEALVASLLDALEVEVFDDGESDDVEDEEEYASDEAEPAWLGRAAEVSDNRFEWCQNLFRILGSRRDSFDAAYPFEVDLNRMTIERRRLTRPRELYVFLLCCSSLGYVSQSRMHKLTREFELGSADVLRSLVPGGQTRVFGTSGSRDHRGIRGSLYEKIKKLASLLNGKVVAPASDFHPNDSGDNGLDLVAWLPTKDIAPGVPSIFAQCACGKSWEPKQFEPSYLRWRRYIDLVAPPIEMLFMPFCYRALGDDWYTESDITCVIVDRVRFVRLGGAVRARAEQKALVSAAWSYRAKEV